jgi:hypothetical protein
MPSAGFKPAIPGTTLLQTYALDSTVDVFDTVYIYVICLYSATRCEGTLCGKMFVNIGNTWSISIKIHTPFWDHLFEGKLLSYAEENYKTFSG